MYKKIDWASDTHFGHAKEKARNKFFNAVNKSDAEALVITGDVSDGTTDEHFGFLAEGVSKPIYFVLGNHDFYSKSVELTYKKLKKLCKKYKHLNCLPITKDVIRISDKTCIIGVNGWGDARYGARKTTVVLWDFELINDLKPEWILAKAMKNRVSLHARLQDFADADAKDLGELIDRGVQDGYKGFIILTHLPPFADAAWHMGQQSDEDFLPYFSCKATGDVLLDRFVNNRNIYGTVLCGHCHSGGQRYPLSNLEVRTAPAVYGDPVIEETIDILDLEKRYPHV